MIARLRRRHLRSWLLLGILLPLLYLAALLARPDEPTMERLPAELDATAYELRGDSSDGPSAGDEP